MAGYDDYQTEEEYIAAGKKRWEREMDTEELVEQVLWVKPRTLDEMAKMHSGAARVYVANVAFDEFRVPLYTADAIESLERERDEARAKGEATARLALSLEVEADERIAVAEAELSTLRARVAKMEEALKAIDAKVVELGLAAQRKANGHKHEKFAAVRQSMRLIVRTALTEEQP